MGGSGSMSDLHMHVSNTRTCSRKYELVKGVVTWRCRTSTVEVKGEAAEPQTVSAGQQAEAPDSWFRSNDTGKPESEPGPGSEARAALTCWVLSAGFIITAWRKRLSTYDAIVPGERRLEDEDSLRSESLHGPLRTESGGLRVCLQCSRLSSKASGWAGSARSQATTGATQPSRLPGVPLLLNPKLWLATAALLREEAPSKSAAPPATLGYLEAVNPGIPLFELGRGIPALLSFLLSATGTKSGQRPENKHWTEILPKKTLCSPS